MSEDIRESIVNVLKKKIGDATALRSIFSPQRVRAGQKVIENTKDHYFDNLQETIEVFKAASLGTVEPQQIYDSTKSLKAQAEGLGFTFLMEVSNSLYKFLQKKDDASSGSFNATFDKDDIIVVRKHSEAIVAALENRERGKGGMVESSVLSSLELLKRKYAK
jgi:hypothetical protein